MPALGAPFMRIEFGSINAQQLPSSSEGRQVFDTMERDFDIDAVKSIDLLLVLKSDATSKEEGAALQAYAERLGATEGTKPARSPYHPCSPTRRLRSSHPYDLRHSALPKGMAQLRVVI